MTARSAAAASKVVLVAALAAGVTLVGCTGFYEIPIETPIQPKMDVSAFQRVLVAGFISGGGDDVDANLETVRLLRSQLRTKSPLRVIEAEVVLVSKKSAEDDVRWVYLDIGKFGGLAETMDESIRYAIRTPHDGADMTPCVLAGPTCDSADVLYEKLPYPLPVTLEIGDKLLIEGTGAYTSTYSSVAFNGIPPLRTYHI